MRRKALKNKDGSALMIAIIIMMIVMLFSVTLLSSSYSLYYSSSKQKNAEQAKELARTISREIQSEITGFTESELTEMQAALTNDPNGLKEKYPLWFYLRENLWQSGWPYYDRDGLERGHSSAYADRYFSLNGASGEAEILEGVSVRMYWEKGNETETQTKKIRQAYLMIEVTCDVNKQKSTITTTYNVVASADKSSSEETGTPVEVGGNAEMWDITYASRE